MNQPMQRALCYVSGFYRMVIILVMTALSLTAHAKSPMASTSQPTERTLREAGYPFPTDLDRESALEILADMPLKGPEGLWEFEPDEVTLMILADKHYPGRYGIYVVDAVDCRLTPGLRIGHLEESLDRNSFLIHLMTRWKKNILDLPVKGATNLNDKEGLMKIEGGGVKLSFTPSIILPNLLSLLRLRVGLRLNNPEQKLPSGLRRVYPSASGLTEIPTWL